MLEILLCSLFTLLPDYLYRRYGQGNALVKRLPFIRFGTSSATA